MNYKTISQVCCLALVMAVGSIITVKQMGLPRDQTVIHYLEAQPTWEVPVGMNPIEVRAGEAFALDDLAITIEPLEPAACQALEQQVDVANPLLVNDQVALWEITVTNQGETWYPWERTDYRMYTGTTRWQELNDQTFLQYRPKRNLVIRASIQPGESFRYVHAAKKPARAIFEQQEPTYVLVRHQVEQTLLPVVVTPRTCERTFN